MGSERERLKIRTGSGEMHKSTKKTEAPISGSENFYAYLKERFQIDYLFFKRFLQGIKAGIEVFQ